VPETYRVESGARLHFTLVDMNGTLSSRIDGGVGLCLEKPGISVSATKSESKYTTVESIDPCSPPLSQAVLDVCDSIQKRFRVQSAAEILIEEMPGEHVGFGTKTQVLACAALAFGNCVGLNLPREELPLLIGRAGTSGVGLATFHGGGFVFDGGQSQRKKSGFHPSSRSSSFGRATNVGRWDFPDWPILLVSPSGHQIHGDLEQSLFNQVCPIPVDDVKIVAYAILMMLMPGVVECDQQLFCDGLDLIRDARWKKFEISSQAPIVAKLMRYMMSELRLSGLSMSSWGTTIACFDPSLHEPCTLEKVVSEVTKYLQSRSVPFALSITRGRNHGARIC
jgi:beta-ribofuranosylaminobenzene 5'-phosphate synthase